MSVYFENEVQLEAETLFAEVADTFTYLLNVTDVRMTDKPAGRGTDRSRQNRMSKSRPGHNLSRSGAMVEIDCYIPGSMVDTASGALATDPTHILLSAALGGGNLAGVGGVAGATATASSMPNATGTRVRGAIVAVGQSLDGRAEGQGTVIGNPDTALLVALPAAPGATDVIRSTKMAYLDTDTTPPSFRLKVMFRETGMQFSFHGCCLLPPVVRFANGEAPMVTFRFMCAYWREVETSTPSSMTLEDCDPAIMAGGSNFIQTVGTATRNLEDKISTMEVSFSGTLIGQTGQGGRFGRQQHIVGWVKSKASPEEPIATLRITYPWDADLLTDFDAGDGSDAVLKHFLATVSAGGGSNGGEGRQVLWYAPQMFLLQRPADAPENQLPYQQAVFGLTDGPDTTNALTRSAFRIGRK